jgi:hypothetical protein
LRAVALQGLWMWKGALALADRLLRMHLHGEDLWLLVYALDSRF